MTASISRIRLLLIDDEANVVHALRRTLAHLCPSWIILNATSVVEACRHLDDAGMPVDVVVTDIQMPGYTGDQLLDALVRGRPNIIRVVLSGMLTPRALRATKLSDRWICKPCPAERLRDEIIATFRRRTGISGHTGALRRQIRPCSTYRQIAPSASARLAHQRLSDAVPDGPDGEG